MHPTDQYATVGIGHANRRATAARSDDEFRFFFGFFFET